MSTQKSVVITGGAGYIGSSLVGSLLELGFRVKVIDCFLYGGDSILSYIRHPCFSWKYLDLCEKPSIERELQSFDAVIHLAAISGFPACQNLGRDAATKYNVESAVHVYDQSVAAGVSQFLFPSAYTAFGGADEMKLVSENAPGNPKTIYAETKIEAEKRLLDRSREPTFLTILRFADIYGISPRTRFDVLINQLVWQALTRREIIIYQRGYWRSFMHISDLIRGIVLTLNAPANLLKNQIYNLGSDQGNVTKETIAKLISEHMPGARIVMRDITFGGYHRDIRADFSKFKSTFHFEFEFDFRKGITEIYESLTKGLIREPDAGFHHNARFAVN